MSGELSQESREHIAAMKAEMQERINPTPRLSQMARLVVLERTNRMKTRRSKHGEFRHQLGMSTSLPQLEYFQAMQKQWPLGVETFKLIIAGTAAYVICGAQAANRLMHVRDKREIMNHFCGLPRGTDSKQHPDEVQVRDRRDNILLSMHI